MWGAGRGRWWLSPLSSLLAPSEAVTEAGGPLLLCGLEVIDIPRTLGRAIEDVSLCRMLGLSTVPSLPSFRSFVADEWVPPLYLTGRAIKSLNCWTSTSSLWEPWGGLCPSVISGDQIEHCSQSLRSSLPTQGPPLRKKKSARIRVKQSQ